MLARIESKLEEYLAYLDEALIQKSANLHSCEKCRQRSQALELGC